MSPTDASAPTLTSHRPAVRCVAAALTGVVALAGCVGDVRVALPAADALRSVADQQWHVLNEYHAEVSVADDRREEAVVEALIDRLAADIRNPEALERHKSDFREAMRKVRDDRSVEWTRRAAAEENRRLVLEIAEGLTRLGIESMGLSDEMRRYLGRLLQRSRTPAESPPAADAGP